MKKQILFLSFVFCLLSGFQMSQAQEQTIGANSTEKAIQSLSKKKADQIVSALKRNSPLSDVQKEQVYGLYEKFESKIQNIESITDASEKAIKKQKLQDYMDTKLETILTEKQFKSYKALMRK